MTKLLVSTDIGSDIDDALSILAMFNSGINVEAIYTTNGDVDSRSFIAKHMVELAGKDIDVARGESGSIDNLVLPYSTGFEEYYVDDRFIKGERIDRHIDLKPAEECGIIPDGVDDLIERLSKDRYVIFSLAPLTNIARVLQKAPEAASNIERLIVMGCRFLEDVRLEHNIRFDPLAAIEVFESDIPITVVPGDLCSRYRMPSDMIENMKGSEVGRYVHRMALAFIGTKTAKEVSLNQIFNIEGLKDIVPEKERYYNIRDYLMDWVKAPREAFCGDGELFDKKNMLVEYISDQYNAAYDSEKYFERLNELRAHLSDPKIGFRHGSLFSTLLKEFIPKEISVADVYIPYCFLHPEKLVTVRGEIGFKLPMGESHLNPGTKHEVVKDLDFEHFKEFIAKYLK